MLNFLLAACSGASTAAAGNGCYDWPVIKQIIWLFSQAIGLLYKGLDAIGIANIGVVIIVFTLIIKFILLPLTIKQQKQTKLMSVMQPELSAVQKKYQGARDQYSMQAMQAEQKAIYAKYGVSQTGGCVMSFIQFPILIALYGALRNIPTAIEKIADSLQPVADLIAGAGESVRESVSAVSSTLLSSDSNTVITTLYSLPVKSWESLIEAFSGSDAAAITSAHENFVKLNSFLGWDISQSPWNLLKTGTFIGIISIIVPLLAGASQWLSFKLSQAKNAESNPQQDQMAATSRMMTWFMPLFSVYICFTLNIGLGIYWCMSSIFQIVLQVMINRHYRKVDLDVLVEQNKEKAEEKAKKAREKGGVKGETISAAANINTKNISSASNTPAQNRPMTIKDIANMDVSDTGTKNRNISSNSLAAKANAVSRYNEEHPEDTAQTKKKYKK